MSIVMKFGGTSVGDASRIEKVADIVKSHSKKNPVVVVSAVAKTTDSLIRLANECANGGRGIGESTLNLIISRHYDILDRLGLDKSLLENDIEELKSLVKNTKGNKKSIDAKTLDCFQSFGERMSSKIVSAYAKIFKFRKR